MFYGFLPAKAGERQSAIDELEGSPYVLVFYEAPHRVVETLAELAAALGGERRIVIARELTKLFETIHVCNLDEAVTWISGDADRQKGEFVLIVDAPAKRPDAAAEEVRRTLDVLLEALPVKQAAALAAKLTGARKNDLYDLALQVKRHREELTYERERLRSGVKLAATGDGKLARKASHQSLTLPLHRDDATTDTHSARRLASAPARWRAHARRIGRHRAPLPPRDRDA